MSSNGIAIASIVTSGATAIAAVAVTGIGGWRDRAHQRAMADTERKQTRLADTYLGLLEYVEKLGFWAQNIRPTTYVDGSPINLPDFDSAAAVSAKVDAYGSNLVRERLSEWWTVTYEIRLTERLVREEHQAAQGPPAEDIYESLGEDLPDWETPWRRIVDELRPAEKAARKALKAQVTAELK